MTQHAPALSTDFGPIQPDDPETRQAARRVVLAGARDAVEARMFLSMAGLDGGAA